MTQCIGVKPNGDLCKGIATRGSDYCPAHDPARKEARHQNAKKAARSKPTREIKDLKGQLEDLAHEVLEGSVDKGVAAVVNQILNTRTRLIETERKVRETEELEKRMAELESLLSQQEQGGGGRYGAS
jgi:uncharacterized Zn finger protein (UPF0148 family)